MKCGDWTPLEILMKDEPSDIDLEHAVRVKDFLPAPKDLVFRKERVVTVRLDDSTVSELKRVADQKGLGVSSLVRMWVRERLTKARASS
jgi:predicted DNA binding CopG/RHH family protein